MSNYFEYNNNVMFHPGYYISEVVEESGLTQYDFAKRLGVSLEELSRLMKGEQDVTSDIAMKLSRILGTSVDY